MKRIRIFVAIVMLMNITAQAVAAPKDCTDSPIAMIILDRSSSMGGRVRLANGLSDTKWNIAKSAVNSMAESFRYALALGLSLFPRPRAAACTVGTVDVPAAVNSKDTIAKAMEDTWPSGMTPMGGTLASLLPLLRRSQQQNPDKQHYAILVADGMETCTSGDAITVAGQYAAAGIHLYVVGFGSGVDADVLRQIAVAGNTRDYYQADDETTLHAALQAIGNTISCCGNGALDTGEYCDTSIPNGQQGACPTSCDDGNPATTDRRVGLFCQQRCEHLERCGNGQLDTGELCDSGIQSGKSGACPADCNDFNPGTKDTLVGRDCQRQCNHEPLCGNGALDPNERCDIAITSGTGACPKDCDDGNPATDDTLTGTRCDQRCLNSRRCGNGKLDADEFCDVAIKTGMPGACPSSCDDKAPGTRDQRLGKDCQQRCEHEVLCGNGKLDSGEFCDTAIAAGQRDACPRDCDDGDPLTEDSLIGEGCLQNCVNNALCGNGKLEPGIEHCDTAIPRGAPGACPRASDCRSTDPCGAAELQGSGCQLRCVEAPMQPRIDRTDGCCPTGLSSWSDLDCPPACGPDRRTNCVDPCAAVSCPVGQYCVLGSCQTPNDATGDARPADNLDSAGERPEDGPRNHYTGGCAVTDRLDKTLPCLVAILLLGLRHRRLASRPR